MNEDPSKLNHGASTSKIEVVPETHTDKRGLSPIKRAELDKLRKKDSKVPLPDGLGGGQFVDLDLLPKDHGVRISASVDPSSEMGIELLRRLYDSNSDARDVMDRHGYKRNG
jgi:hypothetical protein